MEEFIVLVLIVFGILQIILFFKIWGMTNNVKEMRNYFLKDEDAKKQESIRKRNAEAHKVEKEKYLFYIGELVVYEGRIYEVVDHLSQGKCKCKDVKNGSLHSLHSSALETYNDDDAKTRNFADSLTDKLTQIDISPGDHVIRLSDNKEMIVDSIKDGRAFCKASSFEGYKYYSAEEIRKKILTT